MLIHHLRTAIRRLKKNRLFFLINLSGLSLGITACILIIQYVNVELSYDHFNKNVDHLYRVVNDRFQQGKRVHHSTMTYSGISRAISEAYPEVEQYSRVEPYRVEVISYEQTKIADQRAVGVDQSFLSMFSYPLITGDQKTALKEPNSVILTEKLARTIFSTKQKDLSSYVGKLITFDRDSVPYKITGICKESPDNSHLHFDLLMSYVSFYSPTGNNRWTRADNDFNEPSFWHYIQLKPGADPNALNAKLPALSKKLFAERKAKGIEERFYLQPLSRAHLYSDFEYDLAKPGSSTTVWSMVIVAALILLLACINYINLTTAKSVDRAREVGVRKVIGASRAQLIRQFLSEAMLVNCFALMLAFVLINLCQNGFNTLLQHEFSLSDLLVKGSLGYGMSIGFVSMILLSMLISGLYPAFVLSSFRPVKVLKGIFTHSDSGILLRKCLVIGQFAVTIILITGSVVVYRQIQFMNSQPLGYDVDQMLILRRPVLIDRDIQFMNAANSFIAKLEQLPNVKGAAASGRIPGEELGRASDVYRKDKPAGEHIMAANMGVDFHFLDLYKMKLLSGRNFSPKDYNEDRSKLQHVIINESMAKALGFGSHEEPIGNAIILFGREWDIIGVVSDFHQKSLKHALEPTVIMPSLQGRYSQFSVKVSTGDLPLTISRIEKLYSEFFPGNLFDYYFLDQKFDTQYSNEILFGQVFRLFTGLAIIIACLGLLGLSLLSTARRAKEIGVRKVLGASVSNMVLLLSRELLKPILIAAIVATPIAWYIMQEWLHDFAYRIDLSLWLFAGAGMFVLLIAFFTVSVQTIRTAMANPVKSLRSE